MSLEKELRGGNKRSEMKERDGEDLLKKNTQEKRVHQRMTLDSKELMFAQGNGKKLEHSKRLNGPGDQWGKKHC